MSIERLTTPWWALRVALGAAAFLAGLDKFFNLLADWPGYLSPLAAHVLPMSAASFMHVIGIVEMAVGAVILAGYTQLGGYVASIWLVVSLTIKGPTSASRSTLSRPAAISTSPCAMWPWRSPRSPSRVSPKPASVPRFGRCRTDSIRSSPTGPDGIRRLQ